MELEHLLPASELRFFRMVFFMKRFTMEARWQSASE
jgi:hypothetical protein